MIRKGMIDRQIEALGVMLSALLGVKSEGKAAETEANLRKACRDLTGMDWNMVQSLSVESLLSLLNTGGIFDSGKCLTLGVLLHEQGILDEERGLTPVARSRFQKAFRLLSEAMKHEEAVRLPEFQARLADCFRRLAPPPPPQ